MSTEELEKLWQDSNHWSGAYYRCPKDPRLVVPKRKGVGWTINLGHPKGKASLVMLVICGLLPPGFVILTEGPAINPVHIFYAIGISGVMTVAFCLIFSRIRQP
jgi:hypothetical protein